MKFYKYTATVLLFMLLIGCKPTEKGYKAAYDAALSKREEANKDIEVDTKIGEVQQIDGPSLKTIDGKSIYLLNKRIKPVELHENLPGNYNVAVGCYKMITNCKSQSEDLRDEGMDAFASKTTGDEYYTIIGSFDNLQDAIKLYEKYKSNSKRVYVGLPNSPIIIYSPK